MDEHKLKIGLDLDGTINATKKSIKFFNIITNAIKETSLIYIITYREKEDLENTEKELKELGIFYHEIIFVNSYLEKNAFVFKNKIDVFIDDVDESFYALKEDDCFVMKPRSYGNYNFPKEYGKTGKWIYSERTGKKLDEL